MTKSDALWDVFRTTGHIGAYILYRQYLDLDQQEKQEIDRGDARGVAGI